MKVIDLLSNMKILTTFIILQIVGTFSLAEFITKYLFNDTNYLVWLGIAMAIDLITGITKVIVREGLKKVTSRGIRDTVIKSIQYGSFLIITNILVHFEVNGEVLHEDLSKILVLAYQFLIFIEIKSVYENIIQIDSRMDFVSFFLEKVKSLILTSSKKIEIDDNTTNT